MEPVAPGTEDDPPIEFSSLKKQENEQERLLKIKAILPNGVYANVFELSYQNGAEHWFCNACKCPVMGRVYQHENGRRHSINLAMMNRHKDKYYNHEIVGEPVLNIAPGEPVPPGFEPNVDKVTQIQERLDGFKVGPLVALEYLLELQDYDSTKEPFYLCILCDKRGDPRTVLTHLASYNHISQYLQKHFPTCYRALAPYMTKQYKRNWQSTLQKLAEAIEKKYGRMRPMPVDKDKFEKDRMHYLQLVCRGRHFHEQMGCTFEELIVHEELTKPFEDTTGEFKSTSKPAPVSNKKRSPSPPVVAMPKKSKYSQKPSSSSSTPYVRRRSLSSISSVSSSDLSENDSRIRRPRSNRHRSRSPRRHRDKVAPPLQKGYFKQKGDVDLRSSKEEKFDEYRKISKALETDMDKVFKQHEKNPEKHPQYSDEWKKFWNKRYKELQNDGVDVSNYDFKPEWIKYWNKKMIELHQEDMRSKKDALRKRLGLPEEPAPICFRITGKSKFDVKKSSGDSKKLAPMASQPDVDPEVIIIEDKDEESKSSRSRRSRSPWEDNHPPVIGVEPETKRSYSRDRSLSIERSRYVRRRPVSRERRRSISRERRRSKSRDRERRRSLSRDRKRSDSRDRLSRRSRSRSRERERFIEKKREYRESSYERDLRGKERVRVVSDLPWEREKAYRQEYEDYYKPPAVMRTVTSHPVITPAVPPPVIPEEDEDEDINVVSILRLLTALEERLGSLGPKIIDLLAQALAMEKNEANSSENLLDNEINCVLFETVKEKLKGQLLAGFVDVIQERAFKKAIKKTAKLLHLASERKREKERLQPKVAPVTVPGVGAVDKSAIAKQIANALVSQGKTDVSQAELEQLINAVVGMAEASKGIGKPLTTASFLEKFGVLSSQPPAEKTSKLSIDCNFRESNAEPLTPSPGKPSSSTVDMDHLSESDLQTLLQNFKDLSTDEQHGLINYLKKLEKHEPERVERLRKFVNLGSSNNTMKAPPIEEPKKMKIDRESPFSYRLGGVNPAKDDSNKEQKQRETPQKITAKINLDSDEEDYSFDDVVKTVKAKELEKERILVEEAKKKMHDVDLSDAKALISNLMSNINKSNTSSAPSSNLLGLPATNQYNSFDLTKTLNNIPVNLDNLANIVGNVQKLTAANNARRNYENIVPTNFDLSNRSNNLQGIVGPDRRLNDVNMSRMMPNQSSMGMGGSSRNMVQYPSTRFPQQNFSQPSQFQSTGLNALAFDQQPRGAPSRFMGGSNNSRFQGNMPNPFIGNNSNRSGIGGNFNNSGSSSNNSRW